MGTKRSFKVYRNAMLMALVYAAILVLIAFGPRWFIYLCLPLLLTILPMFLHPLLYTFPLSITILMIVVVSALSALVHGYTKKWWAGGITFLALVLAFTIIAQVSVDHYNDAIGRRCAQSSDCAMTCRAGAYNPSTFYRLTDLCGPYDYCPRRTTVCYENHCALLERTNVTEAFCQQQTDAEHDEVRSECFFQLAKATNNSAYCGRVDYGPFKQMCSRLFPQH